MINHHLIMDCMEMEQSRRGMKRLRRRKIPLAWKQRGRHTGSYRRKLKSVAAAMGTCTGFMKMPCGGEMNRLT